MMPRRRIASRVAAWIVAAALLAGASGEARAFEIVSWTALDTLHADGAIVVDSRRDRLILPVERGSSGLTFLTYALSDGELDSLGMPFLGLELSGEKIRHAIYDSFADRLLLDCAATRYSHDFWEVRLAGSPVFRHLARGDGPLIGRSAVYDTRRRRILTFGGLYESGLGSRSVTDRTYAFPLDSLLPPYEEVPYAPGPSPSSRHGHVAVYDSLRDRMVILGGLALGAHRFDNDVPLTDLWALRLDVSPPVWDSLGQVPAGAYRAAIHEPDRDRIVMHGGSVPHPGSGGGRTYLSDLWCVYLDSPRIVQLHFSLPAGPSPRTGHFAAYDQRRRRMLIHGGSGAWPGQPGDELWSVGIETPTPTDAVLMSTNATARHVDLVWYASEALWDAVLERRAEGTWEARATVVSDGDGWIRFRDSEVQPGSYYRYRLRIPRDGSFVFLGEATIRVPAVTEFALRGVHPHPYRDAFEVAFSLEEDGDLVIELLDLQGRRIESRRSRLAAGGHRFRWSGRPFGAGVYFLRLTQGARSAVTKIVKVDTAP